MGMTYNKEIVKKDRRIMPSGPRDRQRKMQMEMQGSSGDSGLIAELRSQIKELKDAAKQEAKVIGYTAEQVNEEITKALKEELDKVHNKYNKQKEELISKLDFLVKEEMPKLKKANALLEQEKNQLHIEVELYKKDIKNLEDNLAEKVSELKELKETKVDTKLGKLLTEATAKIESMASQLAEKHDLETTEANRPKMETVFIDPIEKESKVEKHFDVEDVSVREKDEMDNKVNKLKSLLGKLPSKKA
jgi:hypothetical protein